MPTRHFATFPATGVKSGIDNILHAVSNFIIGKFPQRTIRAINIDTKDKMRDFYKNALEGYAGKVNNNLENIQELIKIPKPHLFVGYTFDSGFDTTETGVGETMPWNYPSAHYLDNHLNEAFPVFKDKERDILIATYNLRVRCTAEYLINCASKEEQISIYVYLKNFVRDYYSYAIPGIKTQFTIPNSVIKTLKDDLYGEDAPFDDIDEEFDVYLKKWSYGDIYPVYRNNKEKDKFYELRYTYNRIDLKLSGKPQIDDGDKKDAAYDNYTIRFPAVVEFYIPITYVIRTPKLITGATGSVIKSPDFIKLDDVPDANNDIPIVKVPNAYLDEADRSYIPNGFSLFSRDEFALASPEDYYDIHWLVDDNENKRNIFDTLTQDQRLQVFKVFVYEDNHLLDEGKYLDIDWDNWIVNIHKGDVIKHQMIELYIDEKLALEFLKSNVRVK